jgi:hypothetical protein
MISFIFRHEGLNHFAFCDEPTGKIHKKKKDIRLKMSSQAHSIVRLLQKKNAEMGLRNTNVYGVYDCCASHSR